MTDWLDLAYDIAALTGIILLIYVMQKTEHDRINKIDPPKLQWFRRLAFMGSAIALCYSIWDPNWQRSFPVLWLLVAMDFNLFINAMALYKRGRPEGGAKVRSSVSPGFAHRKPPP
jgi:hypothetical protein